MVKFAKFLAPCHMGEVLLLVFKLTNWVEGLALLFKSATSQMAKTWSSSCANFSLYSRSFCVPEKWYVMGPRSIWRKRPELCFNYNCSQKNEFILSHLSSEDSGSNNRFKLTGRHNAFEILAENFLLSIYQNYKKEVKRPSLFKLSSLIWERRS